MRVKVNALYKYAPVAWDVFRPCDGNNLVVGHVVRVINLPSAPKANTMGQCYVADPTTRRFICMVSTGSLAELTPTERNCYRQLTSARKRQRADVVPIGVSAEGAEVIRRQGATQ